MSRKEKKSMNKSETKKGMARMNSKSHCKKQRKHAQRRLAERHGITLNSKYRSGILRKIKDGRCTRVENQATRMILDVCYDGKVLRVVYNKITNDIITVFPKDKNVEYLKRVPRRSSQDTVITNKELDKLLDDDDAYFDALMLNSIDRIGY